MTLKFDMQSSNVTLSHLRILVAIADLGTFTLASERLGMSQPGVSHAVKAVERQFKVRLFARRRQGVEVTPVGRAILKEVRSALAHLERLESITRSQVNLSGATLRLALFPSATNTALPNQLAAFHKRYPGVHLDIQDGSDEEIIRAIRNREVDLGMVTMPHQEFSTFPAFEDEMMAVVPKITRWAKEKAIDPKVFVEESFLMTAGGCELLVRSIFTSAGGLPKLSVRVQNKGLLLALVRAGTGVTIVPSSVLDQIQQRGLRFVPLRPRVFRHVAFAAYSSEVVSPAAQAFLKMTSKSLHPR